MNRFFLATRAAFCGALLLSAIPNASAAPVKPPIKPALATSAMTANKPALYGQWRSAQIGGGGFVQNVIPTSNPLIYYTHIDVGGAYRSDDGGKRWRMIHGGLPAKDGAMYHIRALSVNPRDPDDILVAGGDQWAPQGGIFRSQDGGVTWKEAQAAHFYGNGSYRWAGEVVARHPKNGAIVWAASGSDGLFQSGDGGATWKNAGLEGHYFTEIRFDKTNPARLWAAAQPEKVWRDTDYIELKGGYFRSDDGGATWQKLSDNAPSETVQDPTNPATLYGVFAGRKISRSLDGGQNWATFSEGLPIDETKEPDFTSEAGFNALATGPNFVLAASTRGTFYRLDAGQTKWRKIERLGVTEIYEGEKWHSAMEPGKWQHFGASLGAITVDPRDANHWFFSDWFGIYQTRDAGKNWTLTMDGVEVTVLHALAPDPTDAGVVHLGMADNGYFFSENGGARFEKPQGPSNCKTIAVSPRNPARVYATGDAGNGQWRAAQIWVSVDRGRNWTRSPMLGLPDMAQFSCNSIAVSPDDPFTVYATISKGVKAGEGGVYRSRDGGKSWDWISQGLPQEEVFAHNIFGIGREIAAGKNGVLSAISRDRKTVYRFDGAQWTSARSFENQPMSVAAGAPDTFFVGVRNEGVYRSADGGLTWNLAWKGDAAHVAVDESNPTRVAAGVAGGVIWSLDGGATWKLDADLPYKTRPIVAISDDRLYAGTFGSGAFWMPISPRGAAQLAARPLAQTLAVAQMKPLELVKNGDMNAGTEMPEGWGLWTGGGAPKLARDTATFQASGASLRLDGGPDAYAAASQTLALTKKPFTISGHLKTTPGIEESNVAIRVVDEQGKQIEWIPLFNGPVADWTRWEKTVTLPQNAASASLTTTIKGVGSLWLDEIKTTGALEIWKDEAAPETAPTETKKPIFALQNGAMSEGEAAPAGWNQGWTASGKLVLTRDTADFVSGPAALKLAAQ